MLALLLTDPLAGALREHGHKTALSWIITGVVVSVILLARLALSRRR